MRENNQKTVTTAKRGRKMAKEHDNIYFLTRKNLGLTREKAVELFDTISVDRLERIENAKIVLSSLSGLPLINSLDNDKFLGYPEFWFNRKNKR